MPRFLILPFVILLFPLVLTAAEKPQPSATKNPDEKGFVSLFNGKNFDGWKGKTQVFRIEGNRLVSQKEKAGSMYTAKDYKDFIYRFEYKLTPGANNGIGIRTPAGGHAALQGMEIQILDDTAKEYAELKPTQYNGSIYGVVSCRRGHLKPLGQWNTMEIRAVGQKIRVTLNGTVITEGDMSKVGPTKILGYKAKGLHNLTGRIGFCAHSSQVEFRNLRIKEL